jgi:hypothetical protein
LTVAAVAGVATVVVLGPKIKDFGASNTNSTHACSKASFLKLSSISALGAVENAGSVLCPTKPPTLKALDLDRVRTDKVIWKLT